MHTVTEYIVLIVLHNNKYKLPFMIILCCSFIVHGILAYCTIIEEAVICIYVAIGQKRSTVAQIVKKTDSLLHSGDTPPPHNCHCASLRMRSDGRGS